MKLKLLLFLPLVFCITVAWAQMQFFVSPEGNDNNPGTQQQPLASLSGARDAIRSHKRQTSPPEAYIVYIAEGNYRLTEPLILTPKDSGTPEFPIIYKGTGMGESVFSGGMTISGFKVKENGIWETTIPESVMYNWKFDQLYINDKRAVLARTPNNGFLKIDSVVQNIWVEGTGRAAERAQQVLFFDNDNFRFLQNFENEYIENIRFRAYHKWDFTMRHIDSFTREFRSITSSGKGMKPWNPLVKGGRIVFENYRGALDAPGEWFLDNHGKLSYIPLPGQTPENTKVTAPFLGNLISIKGDIEKNLLVEHIKFDGLTFKHSHFAIPRRGSEPHQASTNINAAIELEGVRDITFYNCEVANTGQHGIWFGKGCSDSTVEKCYIHNLGGGGIYLGGTGSPEEHEHTHHITLHNNIIQSGGREFPPSVGVWVGHSSDNVITNNDIGDFFYTGISVGWVWGYAPSKAKRNIIKQNHIHHIGWDLLSDMAAVYTLGKSEGTEISNNIIHHIHAYSYGGWGLYPDEGTSDILMENNLVYQTKTGGFHQHYGRNNTIRNNILAFSKMYQVQCTRVEDHLSFNFTRNVMVFDEGVVLQGNWDKIRIKMDHNLYWNVNGDSYDFNGHTFKDWQKTGHDKNSIIANPNFNDASSFDFTFKNNKAIKKIGFIPFDYSKAGVYGSEAWKQKANLPDATLIKFKRAVQNNTSLN